jgi:TfoX N-terminal domain
MAQDMAVAEMADRIRARLAGRPDIREQKMFGGVAFMLNGNMLVGPIKGGGLLARVGKPAYAEALTRPGAAPMKFTGREMPGFVEVAGDVLEDDEVLAGWIGLAEAFVNTLPPK